MSLTSFLTQDPMQYAPTYTQQSQQLPTWYNDYTQGILQNAAGWAQQGAPIYPGQQVAPLTQDQQSSYQTIRDATGMGSGLAQQGAGQIQSALSGPNASSAAQPYLNQAAVPTSQSMQQFMNPYLNDVVSNANTIANRSFNEQVLPGLQNQFTQAGQVYGGTNQGVFANQLGRNLDLNTKMADASALGQGFNTALQGAQGQAGIYGQLAGTAGGLQNAATNTAITGGYGLGSLGTMGQNAALTQAGAQNAAGSQQQAQTQLSDNTGMQNYLTQFNWPMQGALGMQSALQGIQVPQGSSTYGYSPYGYGMSPAASGLSTFGGLSSLFGPGGTLGGSARGGSIGYAKGGSVKGQLHLPRRIPSAYRQRFNKGLAA